MLRLDNVEVIYSDVILVLKGLSLAVEQGQLAALLGANGAGKPTTLQAVSGLLKAEEGEATDGTVEFLGGRIDGRDPEAIVRMGIFQVMEGRHGRRCCREAGSPERPGPEGRAPREPEGMG